MTKKLWKLTALLTVLMLLGAAVGCTQAGDGGEQNGDGAGEQVTGKIIGIEPGAGIMSTTEQALEDYDLNYELVTGSGATMTAALGDAIDQEKWIVVTGWSPHWKFNRWDLKYLEDPKGLYGEVEFVHTIARQGLKEDMPVVYQVADNFHWTPEQIQTVMQMNADGGDAAENAKQWVEDNWDMIKEDWIPADFEEGSGEGTVKLGYVEWAGEVASTNVVSEVLKKMGYETELISLSAASMYEGVANGDYDFMTSAWLPTTHGHYLEEIKDRVVDLGENLKGTRIGLVVPAYVTIDSITELNENADKFQKP